MIKNKYTSKSDYWYSTIVGSVFTLIPIYGVGYLFLLKTEMVEFWPLWLVATILIIAFLLWQDNTWRKVVTGKSKAVNFDIVKTALQNLGWKEKGFTSKIELTYNKYILKFLEINIESHSQIIRYHFRYATSNSARLLFIFGICSFCEWRFKRALKKELVKR